MNQMNSRKKSSFIIGVYVFLADFRNAIIVERMFASSLVIIVSQQEPRSMHVYHFQSRNEIVTLKFGNTILNVKVNKEVKTFHIFFYK